ncbi:MAG: class I SAM-dependent methyltransferase [Bacteroidota bacterium]
MDNTQRFSDRVENYVKYRPGYPVEMLRFLEEMLELSPKKKVADIGSGTGKLTELLLKEGYTVDAVEPNQPMRAAAEQLLSKYPGFTSIDGTAEATTLPDQSYDFIVAGQAFHWFDPEQTRQEFQRILRPEAWVVLVWNERDTQAPFLQDYEQFLQTYAQDYAQVVHRNVDEQVFEKFYSLKGYSVKSFSYTQQFDLAGIRGRYLSSSYAYTETHPNYIEAMEQLAKIFATHAHDGTVAMNYITNVYYGQFTDL